jgi:hypothetical protein
MIDFGTANADLPYSEDGIIFSSVSGTAAIRGSQGDFFLTMGGTLTPELRIRGESTTPFNLQDLAIEGLNQAWRVETSAGGIMPIPATGTLDVSSQAGFTNITRFDFVNNGGVLNASLQVDDIRLAFVPEPSAQTLMLFLCWLGGLRLHRCRQLPCQTQRRRESN